MRETKEMLENIEHNINTCIGIISGKRISQEEKENSYKLIQENIDTLIKLHSESVDLQQREYITQRIIIVRRVLFNYFANNWSVRIFNQYMRIIDF